MQQQLQCVTITEVPPLARNFEDSCLGAMFKAIPDAILRQCEHSNVTADWSVKPAEEDVMTVYSRYPRPVEIICGQSHNLTHVAGVRDIKVPAGCTISLDVFFHHRPTNLVGTTHVTRTLR